MYVETDFLLALIKDDDWLGEAAEGVYHAHRDELWTSEFALIELLMVAYREELDVERVVSNAAQLVTVRDGPDTAIAAATYVADYGFTPFDAIHLVAADGDPIVSSDSAYDGFARRIRLADEAPE